ncbi:hypothetical protein GC089_11860 [Cellulomonas sp. JZ18]|uniref:hypothetical protein n=1 Tax=Cellulomonas sp. JZ18 TaxID=2654191 RepID=UPI0012D37381|nr:hypothetical protein [Cellulomonas sp. JZ18]QGQ19784.1 hypothetical protein GC089_11860 [Cellulomonas sp. JZ18]
MESSRTVPVPALVHVGAASVGRRGRSYDDVVGPLRRGELHRVRRSAYVPAQEWAGWDVVERHRARIGAVVAAAQEPPVLSHWSAAVVHGLPLVGRPDDRVHVVRASADGGRSRGDVVRHATAVPVEPVLVAGLLVTPVARTVVDLARRGGVVAGVVAGDHALRAGLADREALQDELHLLQRGSRGSRVARRVVDLVDARAESAGESLSRVRMDEAGLPAPVLQHVVTDAHGFAGRVDFWWPAARVVGEFDGRLKYRGDVEDPAEAVWREKVREDRIRATGVTVVRWTWQDAWTGAPMIGRLRRAGVG